MELIKLDLTKENYFPKDQMVLTIGEFDGLHCAHQRIIQKVVEEAKSKKIKSGLMSFYPHPEYIIGTRKNDGYITPLLEKERILSEMGIDYLFIVNFTKDVATLSYDKFETIFLDKINLASLIVGFDFRYGYMGLGNVNTLKEKYNVYVEQEVLDDNQKVGSSLIRQSLLNGDMDKVSRLLGRYFSITGIVSFGSQIGRTIGLKTANVELNAEYYPLRHGVYATSIVIDNKKYQGICNFGNNPSFNYVDKARIEVHIFDFDEIIYNKQIVIEFIHFIRDEMVFENPMELIKQVKKDIDESRRFLL